MPRSVNHVASRAKRKRTLELAKGYFGRGKNVWTVAKNKVEKGLGYAYRDRKARSRVKQYPEFTGIRKKPSRYSVIIPNKEALA